MLRLSTENKTKKSKIISKHNQQILKVICFHSNKKYCMCIFILLLFLRNLILKEINKKYPQNLFQFPDAEYI